MVLGCSGTESTSQTGTGGNTGFGGAVGVGGTKSSIGGTSSSSANSSGLRGGARSTSDTTALGGASANGGASPTGGALAVGGTVAASGSKTATGGNANATGGVQATGGTQSATSVAGRSSELTGGASIGGTNAAGSLSPTGGTKASAGASTNGGASSPASGTSSTGGSNSVACPSTALKSGDTTKKITVGGLSREYILHVPSGYTGSAPVPLVIDFHGMGSSDTEWIKSSPYPAVIDKEGVVSVFPNGTASPNMGNAWNVEGCCTTVDDVAFVKALVADVEKLACIDTKRVYAVGFSMGGGMSNYLACHAADVFAAVGPASFDLTKQNVDSCTPTRPITVISWRGKTDSLVVYAGGHSAVVTGMAIDFLGAVGTFQKWASLDQCTGNPSPADSNNCQTYSQCAAGVQVTLCTDNNGGHEPANAAVVWPMLKKYTLP